MPSERTAGRPTTRRYSAEEEAAAVRMVRSLQQETGVQHGTVNVSPSCSGMGCSQSGRGSSNLRSTMAFGRA